MKSQTRLQSTLEVAFNYLVGFTIAWLIQKYWLVWMGYTVQNKQVTGVTLIFTVVSVIRSYLCRRLFNWIHIKQHEKEEDKK